MEQMPFKKENISKKIIQTLEEIMAENEKNPDSWISSEDYANNNAEKLEAGKKNKFRSNYFQVLSLNCSMLFEYLNGEDRIKFREKLSSINHDVRQESENGMPISGESVDKIDELVKNLIEKTKYGK